MRIKVILVDSKGTATVQQETPKRVSEMSDAEFIKLLNKEKALA